MFWCLVFVSELYHVDVALKGKGKAVPSAFTHSVLWLKSPVCVWKVLLRESQQAQGSLVANIFY
jgi:hypothetical protein